MSSSMQAALLLLLCCVLHTRLDEGGDVNHLGAREDLNAPPASCPFVLQAMQCNALLGAAAQQVCFTRLQSM